MKTLSTIAVAWALTVMAIAAPPTDLPPEAARIEQDETPVRFDGEVVIRATLRNARDLMLINQLSDDPWSHAPGIGAPSDWRVKRDALPTLRAAGVPFEIFIDDIQGLIDSERERLAQPQEALAWFSDFKNLAAINARLDELVALRPDLCTIVQAGSSIQGRPIKGIRISRHPAGTPMPAFLFTATLHAREWAVPMTAMWFAERLVEDDGFDSRIAAIVDSSEVFIFPVMNPDGYEYSWTTSRLWRKNRRLNSGGSYGVDLNRNWATGFGGSGSSGSQSSETYRGTAAFSEPEAAGLRDFVNARPNIAGHIDLHSYSQIIMWPYSYTSALPPESATYTRVSAAMGNALKAVNNRTYTVGNSWAVYGATAGCIEDWTSTTTGGMGWCTEVRDTGSYGFIMPASEILPNVRENMASATTMMEELLKASTITLVSGPASTTPADATALVKVTVTANCGSLIASSPVRLKWKVDGGTAQTANMTLASGQWGASLPATACDSTLTWWVEAETNFTITRWPANTPVSVRSTQTDVCGVEGDLDGDGVVGASDIAVLLLDFGACPGCPSDLDGSGTVDAGDIAFLLLLFS
ncbi:MAG: M14 family zinc carboxypeptidase [Phycisphaerales bacterium]